ncbi:hypothetical protein GCM10023237_01340 [Streptomyces coeruleoprunus]
MSGMNANKRALAAIVLSGVTVMSTPATANAYSPVPATGSLLAPANALGSVNPTNPNTVAPGRAAQPTLVRPLLNRRRISPEAVRSLHPGIEGAGEPGRGGQEKQPADLGSVRKSKTRVNSPVTGTRPNLRESA